MNASVLIAGREERDSCAGVLRDLGFKTHFVESGDGALAVLEALRIDIVVADARLAAEAGHRLTKTIKQKYPGVDVVLVADAAAESAVESALRGPKPFAYDGYVTKPFRAHELKQVFERLVEKQELTAENRLLHEQLKTQQGFGSLIGASTKMQEVYGRILKVATRRHPVLILGESGTGKELVARAIHAYGPWRDKPFVPIDCGALSPALVESELFGHLRGAFTGATEARQGLLAAAGGGTVFLDEIAEVPVELQSKLLRALQEREIKPIGSNARQRFEARILAATNQDPEAASRRGTFRRDLYFRLNVVSIKLPPLRERRSDLPALVHSLIDRHGGAESGFTGISYDAMTRLMNYDWPGNVRELENCIVRALSLGSPPQIQVQDLSSPVLNYFADPVGGGSVGTLRELERRAILQALETTGGDRLRAAKLLGIGKTTIYRKLQGQAKPLSSAEEADPELTRYFSTALTAIDILYEAAAANSQGARKVLADMADKLNARAGHWERMKRTKDTQLQDVDEITGR